MNESPPREAVAPRNQALAADKRLASDENVALLSDETPQ
jgi:hypothetical protein